MNPGVDFYFNQSKRWKKEIEKLRKLLLSCGLVEELKWGVPCYTFEKHNIVLIHVFKEYCAILFFKGALLKDSKKVLIQQTENVQSARQIRFTSIPQIDQLKSTLLSYIKEAVEIEKAGLKVSLKKTNAYKIPEEFQVRLDESKALQLAFKNLTPGRQRAYLLYFSAPKQSKTRAARIEKQLKNIFAGKGLND